jgi:hypothetical protein
MNPTLSKKIERKLIRHVGGKKFYIGKTGREPALRFQEHLRDNPIWKKMILLYVSKSKKYVEDLEHDLVYATYDINKNKTGGGGGPLSNEHPLNFVYVIIG